MISKASTGLRILNTFSNPLKAKSSQLSTAYSFAIPLSFQIYQQISTKRCSSLLNKTNAFDFCDKKNTDNVTDDFKEESKKFYENQVENIIELKDAEHWQQIISKTRDPVIIDLYADWCGPCKKLTPKLENRVRQLQKQNKNVKLLKINIDNCPEIAQALQVKSVPTVYLLYLGQAVDGFQGDIPDEQLNRFFQTINKISQSSTAQKEAVLVLEKAKELIQESKYEEAVEILQNFKEKDNREDLVAIKEIFLTQCYLSLGKMAKFKESVAKTELYEAFYRKNPDMHKFFQLMKEELTMMEEQSSGDPQLKSLKEELAKYQDNNPQHKDKRLRLKFELVELYRKKDLLEDSLEVAMEIIKEDKNWEEKKTNKLVLEIFKDLGGNKSVVVQKYRKILQRLLS